MPLPPAPDPQALRNAILARLGLTSGQAAGFAGNTAFDDEITNYYRQATGAMGNLDLNQARIGSDYETNLGQMVQERDRGRRSLEDMFADRGMLSSSNFTDEMSKYLADYGQRESALGQSRTRGLEDITRNRNDVLEEFERNRMSTEGNYAQQLQDYLLAQAQPAAQAPAAPAAAPISAPAPARPISAPRPAVAQRAPVAAPRVPAPTPPRVTSPTVPKVASRFINPFGGGLAPKKPSQQPGATSRTVRRV